jgi:NAD(P)-dependent dehydrogenase (short-subunit alcohol dehydrogenase family)
MVQLKLVTSSNASLVANQPLVAVFVGATSNIGAHTIKTLAATHGKTGKGLRAYIIGRNAKAAEEIISECQKSCPTGQFRFVRSNDLALMKGVDAACAELIQTEAKEAAARGENPRIDILVQSQANFKPWDPRLGEFGIAQYSFNLPRPY